MPKRLTFSALLGAALSGVLTAVAFPKFNLMFFAWISLLPLLFLLATARPRHGFFLGWAAGVVFYGVLLYWIPNVPAHYGHLPLAVSILVFLLLILLLALTWALFGLGFSLLRVRFKTGAYFLAPFLWVALEYGITHALTGFPWGLLGLSQSRNLAFIQISAVTGVTGVSFMLVLFQSFFAASVLSLKRLPFAFAVVAMAVVHVGGVLAMPRITPGPETFSAALIQGNSPQEALETGLTAERAAALFDDHLALTRKAREAGAGLIIWPEYTVSLCFSCDEPLDRKFKNELEGFVRETGASLLIGTIEAAGREQGETEYFNTALGLTKDRAVTKYAKMHLVPFGEYLPYRGVLGFVGKLTSSVGGMAAGKSYALHSFREIPFASPICYEIIFPDLVRRFVKKGARFLVTITNDGWYGKSAALHQHFAAAAFRAVENRRFLLRAATTGISGIIDPAGRVLRQTEIGTRTLLIGDVTPVTLQTFYTRHGDVFSLLALAVSGLFLLLTFIPTPKKRLP